MKVLVINSGSSSLKYRLIEMSDESVLAKGVCDRIGIEGSFLKHSGKKEVVIEKNMPTHETAIKMVLDALTNDEYGVIKSADEISGVGHRSVPSGPEFTESRLIDDYVRGKLPGIIDLAPLHMPACIMGIDACKAVMPNIPQVIVFDTSFHSTIPDVSKLYAIDYKDAEEYSIMRYGAHGTSHMYISQEIAKRFGTDKLKLIVCHLGNGASISAVKDGKCVDTSMGFTPLEGLVMGTRSGDIDPSVIQYLCNKKGWDINRGVTYLNKECGLKGVSGVSNDFRDLIAAANEGNKKAQLAIDMFSYRVKKYIGAYSAVLDGVDVIVFTAGIGEHTPEVRERVLTGLDYLGVDFDNEVNYNSKVGDYLELSTKKSKVKVIVMPTDEEVAIAREVVRVGKLN